MKAPINQLSDREIADEMRNLQWRIAELEAECSRRIENRCRPYREAVEKLRSGDR